MKRLTEKQLNVAARKLVKLVNAIHRAFKEWERDLMKITQA